MIISNFPRNQLSSFYLDEVSIGMYILWIVEGIRLEAIEDPDFYLFASLNPRVASTNSMEIINQVDILPIISNAYFNWWNENIPTEEKLQISPITNINVQWN